MRQIVEIAGVGRVLAAACAEKGFRSVEDIAAAKVIDLVAVPGVSTIRANQLIQAAQSLLSNASQPAARITNGAGDQAETAQSADDVSASPETPASSMKTDTAPKPIIPVETANARLQQTDPARRNDAKKKKKQKAKAAKTKRAEQKRENKKSVVKKSKKKNNNEKYKNKKKSKKNKKKESKKKTKSRKNKGKSGKGK